MTTITEKARADGATDRDLARPATVGELMRYVEILSNAVKGLKARVSEIEAKGVEYRGVYQAAQEYQRGHLVTHAGGMWHANCPTRCTPGTGKDWTLCVKAGAR